MGEADSNSVPVTMSRFVGEKRNYQALCLIVSFVQFDIKEAVIN